MITFPVDPVSAKASPYLKQRSFQEFIGSSALECAQVVRGSVEASAFSAKGTLLNPNENSFLHTCLEAYDQHVPLVLSPDDVWLASLMAVTKHLELHAEDARKALVDFDGKKLLEVIADDFFKGSPDNDWPRVFNHFSGPEGQIEKYLGKRREMFDPTFSTSTVITKAAMQVQTMAALAPYFDYKMWTRCGLPSVTLLGTVKDWEGVVTRVSAFGEFYPRWAHEPLLQVVSEFSAAARGAANNNFWQSFVKGWEKSGGYDISGEINAFFPYLLSGENPALTKPRKSDGSRAAAELGHFPGSASSVSLLWNYYGNEFKMRLVSGHFGTTIDETSTGIPSMRPIIGWVIGAQA